MPTCKSGKYCQHIDLFQKVDINIGNPELVNKFDVNWYIRIICWWGWSFNPWLKPPANTELYSHYNLS